MAVNCVHRFGQFTRIPEVLVSENASAVVHLRERIQTRFDVALSQQTPRFRLLHHGTDKRSGQALLSQGLVCRSQQNPDTIVTRAVHNVSGDANRTGMRRVPERYAARDVPVGIRQQSVHISVHDDDPGGETSADKCLGAVRNISVLHCIQVDDEKLT